MRSIVVYLGLSLLSLAHVAAAYGQQPNDTAGRARASARADSSAPYWKSRVRAANTGPSIGSPPSAYHGEHPPDKWCLDSADTLSAHTAADYSSMSRRWTMAEWADVTISTLHSFLSDTSEEGATVRLVFGAPPRIEESRTIEIVSDEALCRAVARVLNRELLGWKVGPPPVALLRIDHYLYAYPSRTQLGEWGLVAGMDEKLTIRGVGTW